MCAERPLVSMATGGTTLLEMVDIWHLGTTVSCFAPKEPPQPSSGGRLWRCVPLGVAESAQVSTPAGASEHSHSYPDRWSLLWKREGTVQTRGELVLITGHATATLTAFLRKVIAPMSVLRNYLPWAFPSCYSISSSLFQSPHLGLRQLIFWNSLISVSYFSGEVNPYLRV